MRNITTGDTGLVLDDFFTDKINLVQSTLAFQIFGASLAEKREQLTSIRKGLEKKPLVEALKDADLVHDCTGRAIFAICTGLDQPAGIDADAKTLLAKVKERIVSNLTDLNRSYEDEAAPAKGRLADLEAMKPELEAFSIGPNMTLYSLLKSHLEAGKQIDTLLSARAKTTAEDEADRTKDVFILRSQPLGLMNRFREALVQEIAVNPDLPRDLESKVFSYLDQLSETRGARFTGKQTAGIAENDEEKETDPQSETAPVTA